MEIPTILSGPIIRRVDPSQINIWIATSNDFEIDADLFHINQHQYDLVKSKTATETIQLGCKLFIHLIKVTPGSRSFPTDQLLGYNLTFTKDNKVLDLESFGLLSSQNPHSIIYGDLKYPSFYISNETTNNFLYGSCRKPHGKGDDALTNADLVTEETFDDLDKRPSALFLMGDQIYADDVADPLILFIKQLSKELIGSEEELEKLDSRIKMDPFQTALDQINGRQFVMEHFAKFTSNNAGNHLIQLGEFAVMYLLSFGPQLWELAKAYGVFDPFEQKLDNNQYYFVYPKEICYQEEFEKELVQHRDRYIDQLKDIYRFQQTLFHVQRALANTPTYMIFDDHDITDDWNLSIDWVKNVWGAPLGRHVIANGLTAYWAFQGWGNDPDSFSKDFKKKVTNYLNTLHLESSDYQHWLQLLWEYDTWYFVAPTTPKAVFLDTRTMRKFDPLPKPTTIGNLIEENIRSPQLISRDGFKKVSSRLKGSGWRSGEPLVVVSPTPLYGIGIIESVLHDYVYPLRTLGLSVETLIDFEAWKYNGEGFNEFQQWIANCNPSHCFILSGDVHYASSVTSKVEFPSGKQSNIFQFTSSPMNNMSFSGVWGFLMKRVIGLNTLKRKKEAIKRHCDGPCNLVIEDEENPCPPEYQWRETIHYLSTNKKAVINTDNNMGLLTVETDYVKNHLLKYYGLYKLQESYEKLDLNGDFPKT